MAHFGFIQLISKLANIFGVIPIYDYKMQKLTHQKLFKLYGIILTIVLTTESLLSIIFQHQHLVLFNSDLTEFLFSLVEASELIFFVFTTLGTSFWNMKSWEQLLQLTYRLDDVRPPIKKLFLKTQFAIIAMGSITVLVTASFAFIRWGVMRSGYYVPFLSLYYARIISTSLMYNFIALLTNKYRQINITLVDINKRTVINTDTFKRIRNIKRMYIEAVKLVAIWNKIFGWPLLLIITQILTRILLCLASLTERGLEALKGSSNNEIREVIFSHVAFAVISLVSIYSFAPFMFLFHLNKSGK